MKFGSFRAYVIFHTAAGDVPDQIIPLPILQRKKSNIWDMNESDLDSKL